MTIGEARYVIAHRHEYSDQMVTWAMDVLELAGEWPR